MEKRTERAIRERQRKWDKLHIATLSTRLSVQEAARFRHLCRQYGTTSYAAIREYVRRSLEIDRPAPR